MNRPYEGRTVWCQDPSNGDRDKGWAEVSEVDAKTLVLTLRTKFGDRCVYLTKEQALTLGAHMMNLGRRQRT